MRRRRPRRPAPRSVAGPGSSAPAACAPSGEGLTVGARVGLGTDCFYGCAGGITIGDDTIIGNLVTFHAENHVAERLDVPIRDQGVTHAGIRVGSGCWIGAKATILDGAGSVTAASSRRVPW